VFENLRFGPPGDNAVIQRKQVNFHFVWKIMLQEKIKATSLFFNCTQHVIFHRVEKDAVSVAKCGPYLEVQQISEGWN